MPTYICGVTARMTDGEVTENADDSLSVDVQSLNYDISGSKGRYAGVTAEVMNDGYTNYLYLDSNGSLQIDTSSYPSDTHVRLARVDAYSGSITNIIDDRAFVTSSDPNSSTDEKIKVSSNDTTTDYLGGKLTEGTAITLTEQNDGGNETLQISVGAHASSHQNGGSDEISVAGLSGQLADDQPPLSHDLSGSKHNSSTLANLNSKISDATLIDKSELDGYAGITHASSHQNGGSDEISVAGLSGQLADDQPPLSHDLSGSKHNSSTLANLNSKISDATLIDKSELDGYAGITHASSHQNGGSDEISVAGLSGALADPQTPSSHASSHQNGGSDEISVAGLSGQLADDQPPIAHDLSGSKHNSSTLANLNSKITDATLIDKSELDGYAGITHASSHQNGGSDEISVAGLSGQLADDQPALSHDLSGSKHNSSTLANLNSKISDATLIDKSELDGYAGITHASSHQNGGSDEISVAGLSGQLVDDQPPIAHDLSGSKHNSSTLANLNSKISDATLIDKSELDGYAGVTHASSHQNGGSDEISVAGLSGILADKQDADKLQGRDVAITVPNDGYALVWNQSGNQWEPQEQSGSSGDDKKVKVSSNDTTADYLGNKLTEGTAITLTEQNDGGNETLQISIGSHASSHQNGGGDEISVAGLSGQLADDQPSLSHDLAGSKHNSSTLANLNSKISDATLMDRSELDGYAGITHASSHQNGGSDEISVAGLSGALADPQTPSSHASSHQNGGSDEIATSTPASNSIPKTGGSSTLNSGWIADGADSTAIHDNVSAEISAITEKASPVSADLLLIEDSEASNVKKRVQVGNLPGGSGTDENAIHDNVSAEISAITEKASPVGADVLLIEDSASSYAKKKVQITNLPGGADSDAIHDNVAGEINAITVKEDPVDDDLLIIEDSANSYNKKKILMGEVGDGFHNDMTYTNTLNTSNTSWTLMRSYSKYCPIGRMYASFAFILTSDVGNVNNISAFQGYATSSTNLSGGAVISILATSKITSEFSFDGAVLTVNESGTYEITYTVGTDNGSGNKASSVVTQLEKDSGAGFNVVSGSQGSCALLQSDANADTITKTVILDLNSGDDLRVYGTSTGTAVASSVENVTSLTAKKLNPGKIGIVDWKCEIDSYLVASGQVAVPIANKDYYVFARGIKSVAETGNKNFDISIKADSTIGGTVYIKSTWIRAYMAK